MVRPISYRFVRVLLGLLLAAFAGQVVVKERWREPYPGLFQPGFPGDVPDGRVAVGAAPLVEVTYDDGARRDFTHLDIMAPSKSSRIMVYRNAFAPTSAGREHPQTIAWLRERLVDL